MAQISMQQVKELRDRTQAGLNDCKSALTETDGDIEKAVDVILKKGLAKSAKRAGAIAAEGIVAARVSADGTHGVIVEVNIQTDFAARNQDFLAFVDNVVQTAISAKAGEDLLTKAYPAGGGTVEEVRAALVGKLGENITVRRWAAQSVKTGLVHAYIHMGGKVGALIAIEAPAAAADKVRQFADDTAMQIAAMAPRFLTPSEVDDATKKAQAEIYDAQLRDEGKPEAARPKIIEGKLGKWMKEICLLEQVSVLDSEKTVAALLSALSKDVGGAKVLGFSRFERGEGIEKKEDNFAEEAAKMAGG